MEYYEVTFKCLNCGHTFDRKIPKGTVSEGKGGSCPNCGIDKNEPSNLHEMIMPDGQQILHG